MLSPTHVRLTLSKTISNAVQVEPIGKQSIVQVNRMNVSSSGTVAFTGQSISFGPYTIHHMGNHNIAPSMSHDEENHPTKESSGQGRRKGSRAMTTKNSNVTPSHDIVDPIKHLKKPPTPANPYLIIQVVCIGIRCK
jgi:hypothetical protein